MASLDDATARIIDHCGGQLRLGAPLGIGKPHRLLNAIYERVSKAPALKLHLYTALSLNPPKGSSDLEKRFLGPFVSRHFGDDYPRLAYVDAQRAGTLPGNVIVEEFYMQSGAMLGAEQAQRTYSSLNYTHVARALAARHVNVIVQKVAKEPNGTRLSLSCNPDLSFDAVEAIVARGLPRPLLVAEVDPELPWMDGRAAVDAAWFDVVVETEGPHPKLFGLPRQPVGDVDYAIGFHASALVRDGGTLQIGIGALSDALCHALVLRHTDNATWRAVMAALEPGWEKQSAVKESGGAGPFTLGLYGASEMVNEGFMHLMKHKVLTRPVVEDLEVMRRLNAGQPTPTDRELVRLEGKVLHGAFYLGSPDFYRWLREMPADERNRIEMTRVSHVNEIYGSNEALERLQRREARFFNTCMMMTALGAAVSDGLENGQIVSGVGGQYNFVAMAHALPDARSALMLRSTRESQGEVSSTVVWNYGHSTIPRHLRDVVVTEYGIADLRYASDEECITRLLAVSDARFQEGLRETAQKNGKLGEVSLKAENTKERLKKALAPFRKNGALPEYPLGSDFTPVEQRVVRALAWLKAHTDSTGSKLKTVSSALTSGSTGDTEAMERMGLADPSSIPERLEARLVALALNETQDASS